MKPAEYVRNCRSRQHGSVLVFCLAMLILLSLSIGYSFNVNKVSAEKTRLQNTADAAAYSVASVEARDLNFKSYTNRAMVANQVALAQSISLVSWARFVDRFVENISYIMSAVPPLRVFFSGISKGVSAGMKIFEQSLGIAITTINLLESSLSGAQKIHHFGTIAMAKEILNTVVKKNDSAVDQSLTISNSLMMSAYIKDHETFTKRYSPLKVTKTNKSWGASGNFYEHKERMDEFREVTLDSRDSFSTNRTYNWLDETWVWWDIKAKVRKTGGSELTGNSRSLDNLGDYYTWSAMDTMSMHFKVWSYGFNGWGWSSWMEALPLGWGASATGGEKKLYFDKGLGGRYRYGSSYRINSAAASLAGWEYLKKGVTGRFNGLRAFYDIKQKGLVSEAPGIAVLLLKPHGASAVKTVKHTTFGAGSSELDIEAEGGLLKNRLSALSQAVPYFSRPNDVSVFRRSDKLREYGNLYNPFWQPRLSEVSNGKKLIALAATAM